jgi:L-amino acid N-acyltransferase
MSRISSRAVLLGNFGMKIIECDEARHAEAILTIFNEVIATSTALYDYQPRTPTVMKTWFEAKRKGNYPVVGAEDSSGQLLGFASFGAFRAWPAYKYSVEHSVYVDARFRGCGVGRALLHRIVELAREKAYHVLIGGIDTENKASIALHESLGFVHCATVHQVGFKFGRWLDLSFYQLILPTPLQPMDG